MPGNPDSIASYKARKKIEDQTVNETDTSSNTKEEEARQLESLRQEIFRDFHVDLNNPKNITATMEELRIQKRDKELAKLIKARMAWLKYKTDQK